MNKREKYEPKTSSVNISSCFTNQIREVFWNVQNLFWFEAHLRKYVIRTIFRFGNMRVFFGVVNSLCLMVTSWRQYVFLIPRRRSLQAPPPPTPSRHIYYDILWGVYGCLRRTKWQPEIRLRSRSLGDNRKLGAQVQKVFPGACFSKLSLIAGLVKLFCFPLQLGVLKVLKIVQ